MSGWPAHNYDLANTRATTKTPIDSSTVSKLRVKWRFRLDGSGPSGVFATTPIVVDGTVYFEDLDSNVYALNELTGALDWKKTFNSTSIGPNGVAYGWGKLYGATEKEVFALDPGTGRVLWSRHDLLRNKHEGIDIAPQLYDGTVLVSTVPGNAGGFFRGGALGVVYALNATTGATRWSFNTISDGDKIWGHPKVNGGGGLWYPPAVDSSERVFIGVANPSPWPNTVQHPNGSSRPGPNLYTDSLVALDGRTGKLLWYRQVVSHDVRDYDLMISPILTTQRIGGVETEVVIAAGKMGKVLAYTAADGKQVWQLSVGKHVNDVGPVPKKLVTVCPGDLGGVATPMALADGRLFVPDVVDLCAKASATAAVDSSNFATAKGSLTAVDPATGRTLWSRTLPHVDFGAATVANDVVFTSTYDGTVYALAAKTGKTLWTAKATAGINGFPAIAGDTVLVGAGTAGLAKKPVYELIAYSLS